MSELKILHLTDTHILSDMKYSGDFIFKNFEKNSYSTMNSIKQVIAKNESYFNDVDGVFVTGDLIHEGQEDDYQMLKDYMESQFQVPVFYVLGNHDRTQAFNKAFNISDEGEEYYYSTMFEGIRIIGLDSSHDNSGVGRISDTQLSWLDKQFEEDKDVPTVVLMHHPLKAVLSKNNHLDDDPGHMFLQNSEEVLNRLKVGNILGVFSGHTHSNFVNQSDNVLNFVNSGTAFFGEIENNQFTMINRSAFGMAFILDNSINYNHHFLQEEEKKSLFSFELNNFGGEN